MNRARVLAWVGAMILWAVTIVLYIPLWHNVWFPAIGLDLNSYMTAIIGYQNGSPLYQPDIGTINSHALPFAYPPVAALILWPLSYLPATVTSIVWLIASLLAFAVLLKASFQRLWDRTPVSLRWPYFLSAYALMALAFHPFRSHITLGQIGVFLVLLILADLLIPTTRWPRGILIGVSTAIKLTPGVFIPLLAVTRQWKAALTAALSTAILWGIGWIILPESSRTYFIEGFVLKVGSLDSPESPDNVSLRGVALRWLPDNWQWVWVALAVATLIVGLWAARSAWEKDRWIAVSVLGIASLLASPIAWPHYLAWLLPAFGALVGNGTYRWRNFLTIIMFAIIVSSPDLLPKETGLLAIINDRYPIVLVTLFCVLSYLAVRKQPDTSRDAEERPSTARTG